MTADEPTNPHAEACAVGAMLLSTDAIDEVRDLVAEGDFHDSTLRTIFAACCDLRDQGEAVDTVSAGAELERRGHLNPAGGHVALHRLASGVPTAANAVTYARLVADAAARRRALDAGRHLLAAAADPTQDLDVVLHDHQARLEDVDLVAADLRQVDELDESAIEAILDREADADRGVEVGWSRLDRLYRVQPGLLTVITGYPGSGKSTLLNAWLLALGARHGWTFAAFAPESAPTGRHAEALARAFGGTPLPQLTRDKAAERLRWVAKHFAWLRSTDDVSVEVLMRRADRLWRARHFNGLVIDPWNELDHERASHVTETQHISRSLTQIRRWARRRQVHVWLVAHPRKPLPSRDKPPHPTLSDISGSSTFRDKADMGVVVHRDRLSEGPTEVHVVKVRFAAQGRLGVVDVFYDAAADSLLPDRPLQGAF